MSTHWHLSREQVRAVDQFAVQSLGLPTLLLMENAGRGCADLLLKLGVANNGPVCLCCGKGNNGGDGFVMARHLETLDVPCEVLVFDERDAFTGDARTNLEILEKIDVPIHWLNVPDDLAQIQRHFEHAAWIVDAMLGTGAAGALREPYRSVVTAINASGVPVFAIDIPTGLDCDTGTAGEPCITASATATFVATKPGFESRPARKHCGEVHVLEIGIPRTAIARIHGCEENLVAN